jgi:glycosyltransferase involved in cell wall biosynthesis
LKISIVIPSFNQGIFLQETIESILNQCYPNLEIILIDGGSTDGTMNIIKKYEEYFKYWVSEKDSGQSNAINKGLKVATGDIFAWQNSDDAYLPGTFKYISEVFQNKKNIDVIFGGWNFINEKREKLSTRTLKRFNVIKLRAGYSIPPQPAVFFRKSSIERVGGLNELKNQVMDYDLYVKIINNDNIFITDRILGNFRIHSASKTISGKKIQLKELKETRKELLNSKVGLNEKLFWVYADASESLKDFLHSKLNIFSIRDLFRLK